MKYDCWQRMWKLIERGPSRHWLNRYGEPLYDADRVAVGAHYLGISGFPKPPKQAIREWSVAPQPTRLPILTLDFHRLARAYVPSTEMEFFHLRLKHPFVGRRGSYEDEAELIRKTICALLTHCDQNTIRQWSDAENSLNSKAAGAEHRLGKPWPNVLAREVRQTAYISKATGPRALAIAMDALSLVYTRKVKLAFEGTGDLPELLVYSPALRFDQLIRCARCGCWNAYVLHLAIANTGFH
jgi:hypothetical protein